MILSLPQPPVLRQKRLMQTAPAVVSSSWISRRRNGPGPEIFFCCHTSGCVVRHGFAGAVVGLGVGWMRFAGRKLSDESLVFGSPSVGKSLTGIDESSFE